MTWIAAATLVGGALGGAASYFGSRELAAANDRAAKEQTDASNRAIDLQRDQFNQQRNDLSPWRQAGENSLGQLSDIAGDPNYFRFDPSQLQMDPGYQFRLREGMKALENSAAARGGWLGSNHLRAMGDYAQESASQEYQNAFNREYNARMGRLKTLQSLAGVGQTAVSELGQAGQNYANNVGNLGVGSANALAQGYTGSANATASGYVGGANALNNALGSYINYSQNQAMMDELRRRRTPSPTQFPTNVLDAPTVPGSTGLV